MDENKDHYVKRNKPDPVRRVSHDLIHVLTYRTVALVEVENRIGIATGWRQEKGVGGTEAVDQKVPLS